eukprot:scaffold654259_cov48-Prasinocladus_malaysianus.AAC.1
MCSWLATYIYANEPAHLRVSIVGRKVCYLWTQYVPNLCVLIDLIEEIKAGFHCRGLARCRGCVSPMKLLTA